MNTLNVPGQDISGRSTASQSRNARTSLSRSPHPYHRKGETLVAATPPKKRDQVTSATPELSSRSESSESGTEADDERGPILKGLPAAPVRSHKGLRGSTPPSLTPLISPLPTPPAAEEKKGGFFDVVQPDPRREREGEEAKKRKDEYRKRRQGEIVRRITETLLLFAISLTVWAGAGSTKALAHWFPELILYLCCPILLYIIYPTRLIQLAYSQTSSLYPALRLGLHVPSRFDPGPLLYPVVLPALIAVSLFERNNAFLPVNIVCALSSIPASIFSVWSNRSMAWYSHWMISVMPLNAAGLLELFGDHSITPFGMKLGTTSIVTAEDLVLIFPIHQALISVLEYLTTTSLDPSELQLLSAALINLLLFARTPQAEILKALLWVGGLIIFITCRYFMTWEVALARIPSWKLLRTRQRHETYLERLDQSVCALLVSPRKVQIAADSSDSEDAGYMPTLTRRATTFLKLDIDLKHRLKGTNELKPATETGQNGSTIHKNGDIWSPVRRNTFSALDQDTKVMAQKVSRKNKNARSALSPYFKTLSIEQAKARKYLYAAVVYVIVALVIMLPVRTYVGSRALSRHEPFGWALGYLLGNIPEFRFRVVSNNLERWIALPKRSDEVQIPQRYTSIEDIRQHFIGAANVRLFLCAYCVVNLFFGITTVLHLTSLVEVDTRRKVFHGVMVGMLLPTIFIDPCFVALALSLILAIFLLLDLFRASQLPPISRPLTNFLAPYVDGRDHRGPVIVSHIFLLIGCAIPLWLSLASAPRTGIDPWQGWDTPIRDLSMISGVVCVGMGDAAASLIGRRYGRTKWYWGGGKSLEGSLAFAVAVTLGLMASYIWLRLGGWVGWEDTNFALALGKCLLAGSGASLLESTLTAANDNVVVPVGLWLLVRGLHI